ncbi:cytochrome P450 [Aspergillus avenaceus]|uniref:Cytochrome P450 n=1 Tax=Aspergillus avenaceus TaxID=36643 RepID=A0A5N6TKM4_ASPAV|nr:cytochrome P450 [Aspergillus avenaceus]
MLGSLIVILLVIYGSYLALSFCRLRDRAYKTKLPCISFPISGLNLFFLALFETRMVPYLVNACFSSSLVDHINNNVFKYRWTVKDRFCKRYGGVYMHVTPTTLTCMVSDATVAYQICTSRRSFTKPLHLYESIAIYGPNVITLEGSQWAHHRRCTAMTFNEKNNALVWEESIRQTTEMVQHWIQQHSQNPHEFVLTDAREDILKLTLNIICSVAYGVKLPFKPIQRITADSTGGLFRDATTPPPGYHFTFRSVMEYMNKNLITVFMANSFLPKWLSRAAKPYFKKDFDAFYDLHQYLQALVSIAETKKPHDHNLLEGLLDSRRTGEHHVRYNQGLSDSEILGNLYIFMIAGHETTATTLRFALVLLALHQDAQDYLYDGIRQATYDEPASPSEWDYSSVYPKLVSPLCVMLETLRMFPPVVSVPKWTGETPVDIIYNNQSYLLPPGVLVSLNLGGMHYSEEYWGPNAGVFDPKRWDKQNKESFLAQNDGIEGLFGPGLEYDTIHRPVRGSFLPFSDGSRACMGKKFAQVEIVIALTTIFREYRVELAKVIEHETHEDMCQRAEKVLQESLAFLTLSMRDEVPLLFRKRSSD